MEILPSVGEKDVFLLFYSRLLCKRLMQNQSISLKLEKEVMSGLKAVCGNEYTKKLVTMFNDLDSSQDITESFKKTNEWKSLNTSTDVEFLVLTRNAWVVPPPTSEFAVPKELEAAETAFETYYLNSNPRRKLAWQHHLSKGELSTTFFAAPANTPPDQQGYTIVCPAYQMAALLYFNQFASGTLAKMCDHTRISMQTMEAVLYPLVLLRIILVDGSSRFKGFSGPSVLELNTKFVGKKTKIGLTLMAVPRGRRASVAKASDGGGSGDSNGKDERFPRKGGSSAGTGTPGNGGSGGGSNEGDEEEEEEEEEDDLEEQVKALEAQRVILTEAAIVRILKQKKTMAHRDLYDATSKELSVRFKPTQKVYKKSLDSLLDQEYISKKKDQNGFNVYAYQ